MKGCSKRSWNGLRWRMLAATGAFALAMLVSPLRFVAKQQAVSPASRSQTAQSEAERPLKHYVIQVGDKLDIKLFYNPELNEQVTVRPDGRISLQLINDVVAAGLTPEQLREQLLKDYAKQLKEPALTVIVRSFSSQRIYVDGEVARPGLQDLMGHETVLDALAGAGGVKDSARRTQVLIIRRGEENKPVVMSVNIKKMLDAKNPVHSVLLRPYDVVYVPKSRIANVNTWVVQYVRNNIPFSFGFFTSVF